MSRISGLGAALMILCITAVVAGDATPQTALSSPKASERLETEPLTSENALNRGKAYLAQNHPDDAKRAYLVLFATDRYSASVLLNAMKAWVDKHRSHS